jgi:hypothetical protein
VSTEPERDEGAAKPDSVSRIDEAALIRKCMELALARIRRLIRRWILHLLAVRPQFIGGTDLTSQVAPKSVSRGEGSDRE